MKILYVAPEVVMRIKKIYINEQMYSFSANGCTPQPLSANTPVSQDIGHEDGHVGGPEAASSLVS